MATELATGVEHSDEYLKVNLHAGSTGVGPVKAQGGQERWMQSSIDVLGSRPLTHICMPGSHDAGMSTINNHTAFGNAHNCQTQTISIGGQLASGSRYFDIRPVIASGSFSTGHYSYVPILNGWQGANGQTISEIIGEINSFTNVNNELIILNLSHAINTDAGNEHYPDLNQDQWNSLFGQLTGINHLYVHPNSTTVDLTKVTLSTFIGSSPAVVVIVQADNIDLGSYSTKGFYRYSQLNVYNSYADTNNVDKMQHDQLSKMSAQRSNPDQSYFMLSWTLTQSSLDSTGFGPSVLELADRANMALFHYVQAKLSKSTYPNIIFIDNLRWGPAFDMAMLVNFQYAS